MSANELLDRLLAWDEGAARLATETLPFPRAKDADRLVLAFVRMGGESSPWGVALGRPDEAPRCYTVPEPRNRDAHAAFVRSFADEVLAHVGHPKHLPEDPRGLGEGERPFPKELLAARQLWVPGPTHLEMLHLLDFRYTLAVTGDDVALKTLRAFGRACGWLFRESTRPGQVRVFDATARLREAYVFPAEPVRQRHLGFLLAWLGAGDRHTREARAKEAERSPVGVSMMPELERDTLEDLVKAYQQATPTVREGVGRAIHDVLAPELETRWRLTVAAMRALDEDPRPQNPQLGPVIALGAEECQYQYWSHEVRGLRDDLSPEERRSLGAHPETDFSPVRAAARYFQHLHAHEVASSELIHGDKVLLERALDAGDGITGTITAVGRENNAKSGPVRWTVTSPADESLRLREESKVCLVGARARTGVIVSLQTAGSARTLVIELAVNRPRVPIPGLPPTADDPAWVGRGVTFIDQGAVGISLRKGIAVRDGEGPGAWLTHAAPLPEPSPAGLVRPDLLALIAELQK